MIRRLLNLFDEEADDGLHGKLVASGSWSFVINIAERSLGLLRVTVIAAFLSPNEFGLFGIAVLTLASLEAFTSMGFDRALIQRTESNIDDLLDTTWIVQIVRGLVLFGIGVAAAPFIARFFDEPSASVLIKVLMLSAFITGVENPATVYFEKDLQFKRKFALVVPGAAVGTILAIATAALMGTVWALVVGQLTVSTIRVVLSYLLHSYRPSLSFNWDQARELFGFGKWITGTSAVTYLITSFDDIFVGWYLNASMLGVYQLAYRLSNAPATEVTHTLQTVMRPGFAKVKSDSAALRRLFLDTAQGILLIVTPMSFGILVVSDPLVHLLYGPKWYPMINAMQVFAVVALLRGSLSLFGPLYETIGRPDLSTKVNTISIVGILLTIVPLTDAFGIAGTAMATGARFVVSAPVTVYVAITETDLILSDLARVSSYPVVASITMIGGVVLLQRTMSGSSYGVVFTCSVLAGVSLYLISIYVLDSLFGLRFAEKFKKLI